MSATTNDSSSTLSETHESSWDSSTEYTVTTSSNNTSDTTNTYSSSQVSNMSPMDKLNKGKYKERDIGVYEEFVPAPVEYVAEAGYPEPANFNSHRNTAGFSKEDIASECSFQQTFSSVQSDASVNGRYADSAKSDLSIKSSASVMDSVAAPFYAIADVARSVKEYFWGPTPQSDEDQSHHHIPHQDDHQFQNNQYEIRQEVARGAFGFIEDDMQSIGTVPYIPSVATPTIPDNSRPSRSQSRPSTSPTPISPSSLKLNLEGFPPNPHAWEPDTVVRFFQIHVDWLMNVPLGPTFQEVMDKLLHLSITGEILFDPKLFNEEFLEDVLKIGIALGRQRLMNLIEKLRNTYERQVITTREGHEQSNLGGVNIQQGSGNINSGNVHMIGSLFMDNAKQINHHYASYNQGPQILSRTSRRAVYYKGVEWVLCHGQWEAICKVKGKKFRIPFCQGLNEKDVAKRLRKKCKELIKLGHQLEKDNGVLCILIDAERNAFIDGWEVFKEEILEMERHVLPTPKAITLCNINALELSSTVSVRFSSSNTDDSDTFCPLDPVLWLKFSTLMSMATNTTTKVYWKNLHFELKDFDSLEAIVKQVPRQNELDGLSMEKLRVFSIDEYVQIKSNLQACNGDFFSTWEFDSEKKKASPV